MKCDICADLGHLLLRCPLFALVWANSPSPWKIRLNDFNSWSTCIWIEELLKSDNIFVIDDEEREKMLSFFAVSFELIWRVRNSCVEGSMETTTRYWNNRVSPYSLRHDLEMDSPTLWFSQDEF